MKHPTAGSKRGAREAMRHQVESKPHEVDCLVLGGGITGAGVARDAAMRGFRTLLVDSHDFASGTSHLTSKLIHGGLRYLEHGHFRLVIEGIVERDRLLNKIAPNLVSPLRFIIPFQWHRFPKWALTVSGLQLYGLIERLRAGRRSSPLFGAGLRREYPTLRKHPFGVSFWDAQVSDARLVMSTLRTAAAHGASLWNYTSISDARFERDSWVVDLVCDQRQCRWTVRARTIVNATGPWSPRTAEALGVEPMELIWIKGSHLILRRPADFGRDAIIIRSIRNLRPLWVIPWESCLIVGSTESAYTGDLRQVRATAEEVDDLFGSFIRFFPTSGVSRGDVRCTYAGVRPIVAQHRHSANGMSRRHEITTDGERRLITVSGGKLTTFRRMAEETGDKVARLLGRSSPTSELRKRLRGAMLWPSMSTATREQLAANLVQRQEALRGRRDFADCLVRLYGGDAESIAERISADPASGDTVGGDTPYCLAEMMHLCEVEWVCRLADLVKRRTSLYFLAGKDMIERLPVIADKIAPILGWSKRRASEEVSSVIAELIADCEAISGTAAAASDQRLPAEPSTVETAFVGSARR